MEIGDFYRQANVHDLAIARAAYELTRVSRELVSAALESANLAETVDALVIAVLRARDHERNTRDGWIIIEEVKRRVERRQLDRETQVFREDADLEAISFLEVEAQNLWIKAKADQLLIQEIEGRFSEV